MSSLAAGAALIGWYAFIVFAVASIGQLVIGFMIDRDPKRKIFILVVAGQVVLFAVMRELESFGGLIVPTGFILMIFGQLPINGMLMDRNFRPEWRSRNYAVALTPDTAKSAENT